MDGQHILFGIDTRADLENLQVVKSTLRFVDGREGVTEIKEVQKGTIRPHNRDSDGITSGAAYVFRSNKICKPHELYCVRRNYTQEAEFFPINATGQENFGYSISAFENRVAVGAPNFNAKFGRAYIFQYTDTENRWFLETVVSAAAWVTSDNDQFGFSVALGQDTLAVGAPGRNHSKGAVYIFKRVYTNNFNGAQEIVIPIQYVSNIGDKFGTSVAVHDDLLVVGAAGYDDEAIYFVTSPAPKSTDTSSVFVFSRTRYGFKLSWVVKSET